ncbi:MAG: TraY domain-containing protein [Synergistales bacterium]|nr:TraY domain-containing protein [Synergistales bacterium]
MLIIRLDEQLSSRLEALAKKTGRTKSWYASKAIEDYLDDMEDYYIAAEAIALSRKRGTKPLSSEEVRLELGLDD